MNANLTARASVAIKVSKAQVWHALVNPGMIKRYMFDTTVVIEFMVRQLLPLPYYEKD